MLLFAPACSRISRQAGFTLIEMAVVVVIIGILMAAGLKVASVQRDTAAYSATRTKQEAIKQALINYLRNNRRLPCPDTGAGGGPVAPIGTANVPDGNENRAVAGNVTTPCDARVGVLPWITLGLPRDAAIDGFGNFFTYRVETSNIAPATADDWNIAPAPSAISAADVKGGIIRQERFNNAAVPTTRSGQKPVVAVVSHGKNGFGAYTTKGSRNVMPLVANALFIDEGENANRDATYIQRDINNNPAASGGAYDDVVMMLTPDDLITPLANEGSIKSAMAQAMEDLEALKYQIIELKMAAVNGVPGGTCASGIVAPVLNDPWGVPYVIGGGATFPITISSTNPNVPMVTITASYYNSVTTGTDCP